MPDNLRLVVSEDKKEVWKDPRRHLIGMFNLKFQEETGCRNPVPFATCMNAMRTFEKADESTGELFIDYPDEQTWADQLAGFFKDKFAIESRGLHFTYFLKQFGSFKRDYKKPIPKKKLMIQCPNCKKPRQPDGPCEHCGD